MKRVFKKIALGGTFDNLHLGHKRITEFALRKGEKLLIGLSSDEFAKTFKGQQLTYDFTSRKKLLSDFLKTKKDLDRVKIIRLDDLYGPTIHDESIDAIVVTTDTKPTAGQINRIRKKRGLAPLTVLVFPFILDENREKISSTAIRAGIISSSGENYWNFLKGQNFELPDNLRKIFSKPHGELYNTVDVFLKSAQGEKLLIAVGDETVKKINKIKGYSANLSIVDFKVKRKLKFSNLGQLGFDENINKISVINPQATINNSLNLAIYSFFREPTRRVVLVDGEEDLAVVPCVLLAPLGTLVLYGQPDQGVVAIIVTDEVKAKFFKYLKKFSRRRIVA